MWVNNVALYHIAKKSRTEGSLGDVPVAVIFFDSLEFVRHLFHLHRNIILEKSLRLFGVGVNTWLFRLVFAWVAGSFAIIPVSVLNRVIIPAITAIAFEVGGNHKLQGFSN